MSTRIVNRRLLEDTNRAETESQPWSGRPVVWEVIGAPRMTGTIRKEFRKGVGLDLSQVFGGPNNIGNEEGNGREKTSPFTLRTSFRSE